MSAKRPLRRRSEVRRGNAQPREAWLRIIGGQLRGRRFRYDGDPATRPMKDRVREAVFNLIGPTIREKLVIDLFSGTGAMGFEALSRGACRAVLIERRFPAAQVIQENACQLGIDGQVEVLAGDAFAWAGRSQLVSQPWLVFICPPYEFFLTLRDQMLGLIRDLIQAAPVGSLFVVESDERFNVEELPPATSWDVRRYPPAVIAIAEKCLTRIIHGPTEA